MTTKSTQNNRLTVPSTQRWVPLSLMQIRPQAQRELNRAWADHIATELDVEKIAVFVCNKVDGVYWLVDGQHRRAALDIIGWGDQQVQCQVFENLTVQQEAELFLGLNDRKAIPALQDFRIAITACRDREVAVNKIVRDCGCGVTADKVEGAIGAVGTLLRIFDRSGDRVLARTINIVRDSWGTPGLEMYVLDGIALLCARYNGDLEDQVTVAKLSNLHGGVGGFMGRAYLKKEQLKQPLAQCVAAAALDVINGGRGGKKLPAWFREDVALPTTATA